MTGAERRRHPRAPLVASVVVERGGERMGVFRLANLSAGGVLLTGDPPLTVGDRLDLQLRLGEQAVRMEATVLREARTGHGPSWALAFHQLPAGAEGIIEAAVARALDDARAAAVLIVDDSPEICQALRAHVGRLGHNAIAVGTPLEVVSLLEGPNAVAVALVDVMLGAGRGVEVLAYLAEQHPRVRRVLMSGRAHPEQLERARQDQARFSAHKVLAKPWTPESLALAIAG
jgi:CheY-like chemotaxis protein